MLFEPVKDIDQLISESKTLLVHLGNGEYIYNLLGVSKGDCSGIKGLKLGKLLGKGAVGTAYEATVEGMGKRIFAVKHSPVEIEHGMGIKKTVFESLKEFGINENIFYAFQDNVQQIKAANWNDEIRFLIPPTRCDTSKEKKYKPIPSYPHHNDIVVPKGSFVCENEAMYESIINAFTSELYRNGICVNFINVYAMFTCSKGSKPREFYQTILMDLQNGKDASKAIPCISKDLFSDLSEQSQELAMDSLYVQTLFGINCYQTRYKLSHNDLHTGNVFVEYVTEDTVYRNQKLIDADWYHYRLDNHNIFVPATGIIPKIGDFGKSVMYDINNINNAILGDVNVLTNGYDYGEELPGAWMTNIFHPSYDLFYFSFSLAMGLGGPNMDTFKISPLIVECIKYTLKINHVDRYMFQTLGGRFIQTNKSRPVLEELHNMRGPREVLLGPILKKYGSKPSKGKIVTLGELH